MRRVTVPVCEKCSEEAKKTYDCRHTADRQYCTECYTELHYYLTEPGAVE